MAAANQNKNFITGNAQGTGYPGPVPIWTGIDNQAATDLFGIQRPQVLDKLVDTSNNNKDIQYYMMIMALGGEKDTPNPWYSHYYNDRLWAYISWSSGGGTNTASGTVTGTANTYPMQIGQLMKFQNGTIAQIITLTGTTTTTATIGVQTVNLNGIVPPTGFYTNDTNVMLMGLGSSEASPSTYTSMQDQLYTYANRVGIIDTPFQVTGDQLSNGDFYFSGSTDGKSFGTGDWQRLWMNAQIRHMKAVSLMLLLGQQNTSTTPLVDPINTSYNTQQTNGIWTDFKTLANQYPYTAGSFQMADWENVGRIIQLARGETDVLMLLGYNIYAAMQKTLAAYFSTAGQNYKAIQDTTTHKFFGTYGKEASAVSSVVNFASIFYLGYYYHFKMMDAFNDDTTIAVPGYPGYDMGLAVPFNKSQKMPINGGGVTSMPSIMMRPKASGGYNRKYITVKTDGTGINTQYGGTLTDIQSTLLRSQIGSHVLSAQQGVCMFPTGSTF